MSILVDTGPDLRQQALREKLRSIDAVVYTHAHMDHVVGFDELRAFCWHRDEPLPMHATAECMVSLKQMFAWAFSPENRERGYVRPAPHVIDGPIIYQNLTITPLPVLHGAVRTIGFLFEFPQARSLAYIPDVKQIPDETLLRIHGVDVLVIDALRNSPHPTHFSLTDALAVIELVGSSEAYLTHMSHEFDFVELSARLPRGVNVAYDGLKLHL